MQRRVMPIAIAVFLVGVGSYVLSQFERRDNREPVVSETPPSTEPAPTSTVPHSVRTGRPTDRLATIDANIAFYRERAASNPGGAWADWEHVASLYTERAGLSGDYADWRRAEDALDSSFAAGDGIGPFLTRASFNLSMHRIDRVDADLDRAERGVLTVSDSDALLAMRADVRYYQGRYAEARELAEQNLGRTRRSVDALVSLAQIQWHTGHMDEAVALMDEAAASPQLATGRSESMRAWVLLTRAMLERDRGRFDDALARLDDARALDPDNAGHVDELAAEIHEASGDDEGALRMFREISARTSSPQSIDGVARILRRQGDSVGAAELVGVARQAYESQMALYPEAAWGHAIDHWLRLEPEDVDRMIAIAEGNAEARPYGETRVKLAMAYLLADRVDDARRALDEIGATEWSSAELHGLRAIVLMRSGDGAGANVERLLADAIASGTMDRLGWVSPRTRLPQ